jgi:uncharacterized protein (TIGR03000 family)
MKKFVALAALVLAALFVAQPAPAAAQFYIGRPRALIFGWRRFDLSDWSSSPRFFRRPWRTDYYYPEVEPSYYYPPTAYYPQDPAADVNVATIRMHVPSDARVWFDGDATSQTGADRTFASPSLAPGREYVYHIRVQWDEKGQAVERNHDVTVHAGDRINLNRDE